MSKDREKKQKYYKADIDKMTKKLEDIGSGTFFKPKEGKSQIRILPPWSKKGLWYKEATLHYGVTDESGRERGFPCLKQFGEECPLCDKRAELLEGSGEEKKVADRIRPRTKFYANILDRKTGKVMIWGFSQKTLGILLSYSTDPDYGDISDPEEGFDVMVERTGTTKMDTKYQIRCRPKPSAVEEIDDLELHNLDEVVVEKMDEEKLQEVVEKNFGDTPSKKSKKSKDEDDEDEDEDDDEEDEPKKKKKSSDDEDEDEDDEEDEGKKKKKKKSSDDEDDDDEEDEDEDDEDEEKPRKKKKHKKDEDDDEDEDDE